MAFPRYPSGMKRVLLATLLLAAPAARAGDAYQSLQGMGAAAKTDKGPDAGPMPESAEKPDAERGAAPAGEARIETGRARVQAGREARNAARAERERRAEAAAAAASASQGFSAYWARVYSRLHRAVEPFSGSVSTSTMRGPLELARR